MVPIFTSKGVVLLQLISKLIKKVSTKSQIELKILQYALLCGGKQKETNKLGVKCKI